MGIQEEAMRQTKDRYVTVFKNDDGTFSGVELVNHPTPSGCERWLPTYSDSRHWPDAETAKKEFEAILSKV